MSEQQVFEAEVVHDLPDEIANLVGQIIIAHAKLEHKLTTMIGLILQLDKAEMRLTIKEPRTYERLDMIIDLLALKAIEFSEDTREFRKSLETANNRRDRLPHGIWLKHPETGDFYLRVTKGHWPQEKLAKNTSGRLKRVIYPEPHAYGCEELEGDLGIVLGALDQIDKLGAELDYFLATSPERFQQPLPPINPLGRYRARKPHGRAKRV